MPFLRAALVKKKTPEPEEEIFQPAAVPVPVIPDDIDESGAMLILRHRHPS